LEKPASKAATSYALKLIQTSARPRNIWFRGNIDSPIEGKWGGSFKG